MSKLKIAFFDTKPYDKRFFEKENKNYHFNIKYFKNHLNEDTSNLAMGFDVVCAFVNDTIDQKVIRALESFGVKLIAMRCAGFNNVSLNDLNDNIKLVRVPEYSPHGVAEHAVALIMTLNRKTHKAFYRTRDNNFAINGLLGFDMYNRTAGIIGTGKIGKKLVPILKGFGMKVLLYDLYPDESFAKDAGVSYVSLEELYKQSDIISLHCPLTKETYRIIDEEAIALMKKGVMIINTSRGKLIDTKALIKGLKSGKVGSAGLDVYEEEEEYFFEDMSGVVISDDILQRLLTFPNVLVTSHQAFFTEEALTNIAHTTLQNIQDFEKGKELINEVQISNS